MDFLKKHYEKILLGLVLAGLVGALVFMPFYISSDNQAMNDLVTSIINTPVTELPAIDLSGAGAVAARLRVDYNLDLETTNRVFNPMEWQKAPDDTLVRVANQVGPQMVVVTNIAPLYLIISLDAVTTNELGARYAIGVERQAEKIPAKRRHAQRYVSKGDKPNETFELLDVKGAPEDPDQLVLKLVDTGEVVSISHDKPYRRVDGYMADFRYDLEKKSFHNRRAGDRVSFSGTDFTVDAVNENELILQDQSNLKKTTRPFTP
jgi:hypothetical protein